MSARALVRSSLRADHLHGTIDPSDSRVRLLRLLDGFDVLSLMREAQFLPAVPRRCGLERLDQIRRRLHHTRLEIEIETHVDRVDAVEPGRRLVAPAQRNKRRPTHRGYRAAERIAVQR